MGPRRFSFGAPRIAALPALISVGAVLSAGVAGCNPDDGFVVFNTPPVVSILEPADDAVFEQQATVTIRALVADDGGVENLELQWSSSIDQMLFNDDTPDEGGHTEIVTANLSVGSHVITLRAFDLESQAGEGRVTLHIEGVPDFPFIEIEHPTLNEDGLEGEPFRFQVHVEDHQTAPHDLLITAESDVHGPICTMQADSTGIAYCEQVLGLGQHFLTFAVTDLDGFTSTATAVFEVVSLLDYDADGDGFTPNQGDCDDANNTVYPGAPELCDNKDNDCNAATPIDVGTLCYDDDGDNYCEAPPCRNASGTGSDCNDANVSIHPGAVEIPDGLDNDCNNDIDDGTTRFDDDGDGYCETPPCVNVPGSTTASPRDCNDNDFLVNPGMTEVCSDGKDNDCNGSQNDPNAIGCHMFWFDGDGDLYGRISSPQSACYCDSGIAPYTGSTPTDCDDTNSSVKPGQTAYFTFPRANGSYDYNCNGAPEPQYGSSATCYMSNFDCRGGGGWRGSVAGCGQNREWIDSCDFDYATLAISCILPCGIGCIAAPASCASCIAGICPGAITCDTGITYQTQGCR